MYRSITRTTMLSRNLLFKKQNLFSTSWINHQFKKAAFPITVPQIYKRNYSMKDLGKESRLYEINEGVAADHFGRQQNHLWSREEVDGLLTKLYRHQPQSFSDHLMNKLMYTLYHTFNFVTGYDHKNPSVKSIEWRLIVLESVAGVPGFVAAAFRHFKSLRLLQRDHGWIATLLEEAENERMHLLVCLKMFNTSLLTRLVVIGTQIVMTPFLITLYTIHPRSMHRFVGYLEETACHTYATIIEKIETPGTKLNAGWSDIKAPEVAIGYWRLPKEAMWVDALRCMFADEAKHRDVNHTFAELNSDDTNPFVEEHRKDAMKAFKLQEKKERAW